MERNGWAEHGGDRHGGRGPGGGGHERAASGPPLEVALRDQAAAAANDADCAPLLGGQVGALCRPNQGGREVIRDLVDRAAAVLERLAQLR